MFSIKSSKNADACRFCWMCRHVCPVGHVTGNEAYTPRGRGLLVSMDARGREYSSGDAAAFFNCCLCSACADNCVTGYDPTIFIREARSKAVAEGWVSPEMEIMITKALEGSLFCEKPDSEFDAIKEKHLDSGDVLVLCCGYTKSVVPLLRLLEKNGISWSMMANEPDSGANLGDLIGYLDDVKRVAEKFAQAVNETEAKTVVIVDPTVMKFIKECFGEWGIILDSQPITSVSYVVSLIDKGKIAKPKHIPEGCFTFHDPCKLSRGLDDVISARRIIEYSGVAFKEMFLNGKQTRCCGGPVLWNVNPQVAQEIVQTRWNDVERAEADTIVTACPCCFEKFNKTVPEGKKTVDIFELLI